MTETKTPHVYANGDEVRVIKTGQIVVLTSVNPREDYVAEDETQADAKGINGYSYFEIDSPTDVELVRAYKDIPAKKLPTAKELANYISSSMHSGFGEDITINETDTNEPDGELVAYGVSSTGQPFGCRITVSEIDWTSY